MSHFTKIATKLYDRTILEKSLSDLNIEWEVGVTKIRGYNNQEHSAEIVVRQENNHDLGFKWNGKEYELVADLMFWDQKYSVNKFLNQINQRYAFNLITKVSEEQSFQYVGAENQNDGSIKLLLRKFK
jgi:GTP cyclohydrolase II